MKNLSPRISRWRDVPENSVNCKFRHQQRPRTIRGEKRRRSSEESCQSTIASERFLFRAGFIKFFINFTNLLYKIRDSCENLNDAIRRNFPVAGALPLTLAIKIMDRVCE